MNNEQKPQLTIPRVIGCLSFFNADNLEIMRGFKDNEFDLAIVDPPYGIKINMNMGRKKGERKKHVEKDWDNGIPPQEYFDELFRVSVNQIVWGGNYFPLPLTKAWIFWDKEVPDGVSFADGELAWTSFDKTLVKAKVPYSGFVGSEGKIHPTQKPVALYDWLLKHYAEPNQKILDTHLGSGSIAIAIEKANRLDKMNLQFVGIEIDKEYYEKALNRIEQYCRQGTLSF